MYDNFEEYYDIENSEVNNLFKEYKDKCMELISNNIKSEINEIKQTNQYLTAEIDKLRRENKNLIKEILGYKKIENQTKIIKLILNNIKKLTNNTTDKNEKIYQILDCIFKKDYVEYITDAPLWIGCLTQYYSHKNEVIEILNMFEISLPKNIENFKLPCDWNEEELDIFFNNMQYNVNCNGTNYERNLKFWNTNSLKSVQEIYSHHEYTNIPWQYVLRNPLLKKEKYLKIIGQNFTNVGSWYKFEKITEYLPLTDKEIQIIISNINLDKINIKNGIGQFIVKNLKYVKNEKIFDMFYGYYSTVSQFYKIENNLLYMPYQYIKKWVSDPCISWQTKINWIKTNESKISEIQKKELLKIIFDNL